MSQPRWVTAPAHSVDSSWAGTAVGSGAPGGRGGGGADDAVVNSPPRRGGGAGAAGRGEGRGSGGGAGRGRSAAPKAITSSQFAAAGGPQDSMGSMQVDADGEELGDLTVEHDAAKVRLRMRLFLAAAEPPNRRRRRRTFSSPPKQAARPVQCPKP